MAYTGIPVTKNGYLYIWVSNETKGWDVFFDNLSVKHYSGPISEENHYYPFGLTMAGISDKAALGIENKYKYNGKELQHNEFSDGSGLEAYDFGARMQDPQLGRWWTVDPKADDYYSYSPYNYVLNNPLSVIDPDGMEPIVGGTGSGNLDQQLGSTGDDEKKILDVDKMVRSWGIKPDADDQSTDDNTNSSNTASIPISVAVSNFLQQQSDTTRPSGGGAKSPSSLNLFGSTETNTAPIAKVLYDDAGDRLTYVTIAGVTNGKEGELVNTDYATNGKKNDGWTIKIGIATFHVGPNSILIGNSTPSGSGEFHIGVSWGDRISGVGGDTPLPIMGKLGERKFNMHLGFTLLKRW